MPAKNSVVSNYYSGQGIVLMASRDVDGNPLGFRNIGNVSALDIAVATTVAEHQESSTGARGIDLRLTTQIVANVNITMESFNAENLALGLYGDSATTTAGAVVDEVVICKLDKTVALNHLGVTNVVVKDTATGLVTYLVDVDYTVNPEVGSINFISGGTPLTEDESLDISYDYADYDQVEALTVAQPERWLRFEGLNTADGNKAVVVDIFKFGADPLAQLALIGDAVGQIQLAGSALADTGRVTGSKYFRQRIAAA